MGADLFGDEHQRLQLLQAALYHDIAYADPLKLSSYHPLDGAIHLAHVGADEEVIEAILYHSDARGSAKRFPEVESIYCELDLVCKPSLVADALTFCDRRTSPSGQPISLERRLQEVRERYGVDHPVVTTNPNAPQEFRAISERIREALVARHGSLLHMCDSEHLVAKVCEAHGVQPSAVPVVDSVSAAAATCESRGISRFRVSCLLNNKSSIRLVDWVGFSCWFSTL